MFPISCTRSRTAGSTELVLRSNWIWTMAVLPSDETMRRPLMAATVSSPCW